MVVLAEFAAVSGATPMMLPVGSSRTRTFLEIPMAMADGHGGEQNSNSIDNRRSMSEAFWIGKEMVLPQKLKLLVYGHHLRRRLLFSISSATLMLQRRHRPTQAAVQIDHRHHDSTHDHISSYSHMVLLLDNSVVVDHDRTDKLLEDKSLFSKLVAEYTMRSVHT